MGELFDEHCVAHHHKGGNTRNEGFATPYVRHLKKSTEFLYHILDFRMILEAAARAYESGDTEAFVDNGNFFATLREAHRGHSDPKPEIMKIVEII